MPRRTDCHHWTGEEAYDADRGRAIAAAVKALRCDAVAADETRMRRRYGRDPEALRSLDRRPDG
ncbi:MULTISPECIES: hypothetical protein [Methylobacterium]|nr:MULTISPECIES: hypothetical protein [Methylobacterium]